MMPPTSNVYLIMPAAWWGKLLWAGYALAAIWFLWHYRSSCQGWSRKKWGIFLVLLILTPLVTLGPSVHMNHSAALTVPDVPQDLRGPALVFFSALPWIFAAGTLNPCAAFALGFFGGLLRAISDTHNLFTPLITALLAFIFTLTIHQNYRSRFYRWVRQPLLSAWLLLPIYTFLYMLGAFATASSDIAASVDYAFSNVGNALFAFGVEVTIAALIAQIVKKFFPQGWYHPQDFIPAPTERSLERRLVLGMGVLSGLLLFTLLVGDWVIAGRAARLMLKDRLASTGKVAADTVPFFLETGQNLATRIATSPEIASAEGSALQRALSEQMLYMPYFDELLVYGMDGNLLAAYPPEINAAPDLQLEEINGFALAGSGVATQVYTISPRNNGRAARVSFLVTVLDAKGQPGRILIGRSALDTNPLMQPLLNSLRESSGYLLDGQGRVLFDSSSVQTMYPYPGKRPDSAQFYDDTAPDGTRRLVYYQPTTGRDWAIALTVPASEAQKLALDIAAPLSLMVLVLALVSLILLRLTLRSVTSSLHRLSREAELIAHGNLGHAVTVEGVDELGTLSKAFEQMRISLKARLTELNRLLVASREMASSLEMGKALRPILESARATGASAVRVILLEETMPDMIINQPLHYSTGRTDYAYLDKQLIELLRDKERILLNNIRRASILSVPEDRPCPATLLALPLRQKNRYYGIIWLAYDLRSHLDEADIRFITTLAGQASLAVANAALFLQAEVGRQHLEAILDSSPDPILVTDSSQRLQLANVAALSVFNLDLSASVNQPVAEIFQQPELISLLTDTTPESHLAEMTLPNGKTYLATASSVVLASNLTVGRVCILRDVTYLKEIDAMKSEFVSTVSHDLRSPLTLMRGYATMLEMVGELNEQQRSYLSKIVVGVENMSRLVNNLLDLGRIEAGVGLNKEKIHINDIIDKVIGGLQLYANQKEITLSAQPGKNLPQIIEADPALLHQAVYNLVENAIKYTPESGRVTLGVERKQNYLIFSVQDTGIGISPEDQKHLFEKFFRSSDREARKQKGTGLGLAIVRSIAERHGGKVWVESVLGQGSTFYFAIPIS